MGTAELLGELAQAWLAAGTATLLVLATRVALRRLAGARAVVLAWALVPLAVIAVLLPPREAAPVPLAVEAAVSARAAADGEARAPLMALPARDLAAPLLLAWLLGALALLARQAAREARYRRALGPTRRGDGDAPDLRRAAAGAPVPAVVGLWRPRVVLPEDFEARHPGAEGALVLAHERAHLRHHDTRALALAELLRAALWPQPLLHLALPRLRRDLELAADAAVLAAHPAARRAYADALLRGALDAPPPPLACAWPASPHPLTERIAMLVAIPPTRPRAARALLPLLAALVAGAAWAAQPAVAPAPVSATAAAATPDTWLLQAEVRVDHGAPLRHAARGGAHRIDAGDWTIELAVAPAPDPGQVLLASTLRRNGEVMGEPRLIGMLGQPMQVEVGGVDHHFAMGLVVHPLAAGDAAPAFTVSALREAAADATPDGATDRAPDGASDGAPAAAAGDRDAAALDTSLDLAGVPREAFDGRLVLRVDIDADGRVAAVEIAEADASLSELLRERTREAARGWRFAPALRDGRAVPSQVLVPVDFAPDPPAADAAASS